MSGRKRANQVRKLGSARDRKQRAGQEPRHDRDRRHAGDVLLRARDAGCERLGRPVHADREERGGAEEPEHARPGDVEVDAAGEGHADQDADLERRHAERDDQVPEHEQRARHRRGQQLALGAGLAVDDHAEPGEHRVQRDQQADRAGGDERLVRAARVERVLQRGRDHEREQDRGQQRHDQLARCADGELETAARERRERAERVSREARKRPSQVEGSCGHVVLPSGQAASRSWPPVSRR